MKLLTRTYLHFAWIGLLVFLAGAWLFYMRMDAILNEETQEKLMAQSESVVNFVSEKKQLPPADLLTGFPQFKTSNIKAPFWTDTLLFREDEGETLPYRLYQFPIQVAGKNYLACVGMSLFEQDDLLETVSYSFVLLFACFLLVLILSSFLLTRNTWKPFMSLLQIMENYQPGKKLNRELIHSRVREFESLRIQLQNFIDRNEQEYNRLRAFSENAAHELQTPLAVLQSKTEQLMQSPVLGENELKELGSFQDQLTRLRKINQTLLLLTRIDHGVFPDVSNIQLDKLLQRYVEDMRDLFEMKGVELHTSLQYCSHTMSEQLAEVLVANLLNNALKYTLKGSSVFVYSDRNGLRFENNGSPLRNADAVFERFYKDDPASDSTGLGLSIAKSITEQSNLNLSYLYDENENKHIFMVSIN